MADINPVLDLIDGAIRDYISPDAMRWTAEPAGGAPADTYCPPCPQCGRPVETITRGRTRERGPSQPTTYGPCGCQPGAAITEADQSLGEHAASWIEHHLNLELTAEQENFVRCFYNLPGATRITGARIVQFSNAGTIEMPDSFEHIDPPFRRLHLNQWLDESHYFIGPDFQPTEEN